MKSYQPGNAIFVKEELTDPNSDIPHTLVDATSITISLFDPTNAEIVTAQAMTHVSLGRYQYLYQSSPSDVTGPWTAVITVVRGGNTNIKNYTVFNLTTEPDA